MVSTKILRIDPVNPEKEKIKEAANYLLLGGLVVFPTETVYGLGAVHSDKSAVTRLYEVKNRPETKPFTVHISHTSDIAKLGCEINEAAGKLIGKFWPGPLTIILSRKTDFRKIGFRLPSNKIALMLIDAVGVPLVAPSANLRGEQSPRNAREALKDMSGVVEIVIDGGNAEIGIDSTVVDASVDPVKILREGAVSAAAIEKALKAA